MNNHAFDPVCVIPVVRESDFRSMKDLCLEYAESIEFELNYQDLLRELAVCTEMYNTPNGIAFLLKINGVPAGIAGISKSQDRIALLKRFYIKPDAATAKNCKLLLDVAIDWAQQSRFKWIQITSNGYKAVVKKVISEKGFRERMKVSADGNHAEPVFEKFLLPVPEYLLY